MITSSREKDFEAKAESESTNNNNNFSTKAASSRSRQWSAFKNPRIVRVSRSFGGKDRHSKVCTIRGLRDRRIRLSVPTAIQLYDLQERLGLTQPSKVVDWLLDATKYDIDKLPPLQMPPPGGDFFSHFHQPTAATLVSSTSTSTPQSSSFSPFFNANSAYLKDIGGGGGGGRTHSLFSSKEGVNFGGDRDDDQLMGKSEDWESDATMGAKLKEANEDRDNQDYGNGSRSGSGRGSGGYIPQVSAHDFFPIATHSSFPNLLNNAMPYNSYYNWEPSNLSLSQFGSHGFPSQTEDSNIGHLLSLPSSFPCPPAATPSNFLPYPP